MQEKKRGRPDVRNGQKGRTIWLPEENWEAIKALKLNTIQFIRDAVCEKLGKTNAAEEKISKIKEIVNQ